MVHQSGLKSKHPKTFWLANQVSRYGPNKVIAISTGIIVSCSLIFTAVTLIIFQGYIDFLGIAIAISAPSIIFPPVAKAFLTMFVRLQQTENELRQKHVALKKSLHEIKTLSGLLPMCCNCKKIRDDEGYWNELEQYICDHSEAKLTHGFCPSCVQKLYPDI